MARMNNATQKSRLNTARRAVRARVNVRGPQTAAPRQRPNGFAFVVRVGETLQAAPWHYVTFEYGTVLGVASQPYYVFPEINNDCHRFWKRVVIDGTFTFEVSNVWTSTLRLIEVHQIARDVTDALFPDAESYDEARKFAALSKLSAQEAEILGVATEYTVLKIIQTGPQAEADEALSQTLRGNQDILTLDRLD